MWYQAWHGWGAEPEPRWIAAAASGGRAPMLTWEPWERGGGPAQPRFRLSRIADGEFDGYVVRWARALRDAGTTVFLRPMHEMNGTWYPWGGTVNGNTPEDYKRAWRRLRGLFDEHRADNVRWVWSPNATDVPDRSNNLFELYYPGDDYVDVLGVDGYNWGAAMKHYGGWRSFEDVFADACRRLELLGPQPIWVAETASDSTGGDKAAWVRGMLAAAVHMPRLQAIVWFDVDKERDWRACAPPGTEAAFSSIPV